MFNLLLRGSLLNHFNTFLQDFCYEASPDTVNMVDVINMCVTVIAYAPDSFRAVQMLVGDIALIIHTEMLSNHDILSFVQKIYFA